jgi:hypothetical protein
LAAEVVEAVAAARPAAAPVQVAPSLLMLLAVRAPLARREQQALVDLAAAVSIFPAVLAVRVADLVQLARMEHRACRRSPEVPVGQLD